MSRLKVLIAGLALAMLPGVSFAADKVVNKVANKVFDPTSDAAKDLVAAKQQAKAEHKNILLDVGGNWCGWCLVLDKLTHQDAGLNAALEKGFVVVHVNYSNENKNEAFLKQFPAVNGFPYFFVLSADGNLLKNQSTDMFESDHSMKNGYDRDKLERFFVRWAPKGTVL